MATMQTSVALITVLLASCLSYSDAASCVGHCGNADLSTSPPCFCDSLCFLSGDCCSDFEDVCNDIVSETTATPADTSVDNPGEDSLCISSCGNSLPKAQDGGSVCFCDSTCLAANDCCPGYSTVCGDSGNNTTVSPGACVDKNHECGQWAELGQCDMSLTQSYMAYVCCASCQGRTTGALQQLSVLHFLIICFL